MRVIVSFLILLVACLHNSAIAQEVAIPKSKSPSPPIFAWNGSYSDAVALEVPGFRGIEPKLGLTYNSSGSLRDLARPGGVVGIGWTLFGISSIDRVSGNFASALNTDPKQGGKGVAAFEIVGLPEDSYTLNGQELVRCNHLQTAAKANSPSCSVNIETGTIAYAGRKETY
jgi:hypothetical protein